MNTNQTNGIEQTATIFATLRHIAQAAKQKLILAETINPFDMNNIRELLTLSWKHKSTKAMFNRMADFFVNPVDIKLSMGMNAVHEICVYDPIATLNFLSLDIEPHTRNTCVTFVPGHDVMTGDLVLNIEGAVINEQIAVMFMLYCNHAYDEKMEKRMRSMILKHLNTIYQNHLQAQAS